MKVGIIAPISMLGECCITNIQYCLPTLIVESREYRNFYLKRLKLGNTILMDLTEVGWKRRPPGITIVKKALSYIRPSSIILPSYMYDYKSSIDLAQRYIKELKNYELIGCIEGVSTYDVRRYIGKIRGINTFAIPSHLHNIRIDPEYNKSLIYIDSHLNIEELDKREGILVTSLPVRLGLEGRVLSDYKPRPPSLTFYEEKRYPVVVRSNIEEVLDYYGN